MLTLVEAVEGVGAGVSVLWFDPDNVSICNVLGWSAF